MLLLLLLNLTVERKQCSCYWILGSNSRGKRGVNSGWILCLHIDLCVLSGLCWQLSQYVIYGIYWGINKNEQSVASVFSGVSASSMWTNVHSLISLRVMHHTSHFFWTGDMRVQQDTHAAHLEDVLMWHFPSSFEESASPENLSRRQMLFLSEYGVAALTTTPQHRPRRQMLFGNLFQYRVRVAWCHSTRCTTH